MVDVQAHVLVPAALPPASQQRGADDPLLTPNRLRQLVDLDTRLAAMDAAGVDVQAVSVVPWQWHYRADGPRAGAVVDAVNCGRAALVRRAPDRLVGVATVALQYPDLAAQQLRRAVDDYDFRGVQIADAAGGRDLTDPDLTLFWTIAASLGVPVFVHPAGPGPWSWPALEGVMDRFPELALCAAHPCDCSPRSGRRAEPGADGTRAGGDIPPYLPSERRLYADSPVHRGEGVYRLVRRLGPHRVLLGSGYPFGPADAGAASPDTLSRADREAIRVGNACELLRLRRA